MIMIAYLSFISVMSFYRYRDQIEQSLARKKQFEQQTKMRRLEVMSTDQNIKIILTEIT